MKNSPATKASSPSAATVASPVNAVRRAAMVPAAVANAVAVRRAVVPSLAIARVAVSAVATGAMIGANPSAVPELRALARRSHGHDFAR